MAGSFPPPKILLNPPFAKEEVPDVRSAEAEQYDFQRNFRVQLFIT